MFFMKHIYIIFFCDREMVLKIPGVNRYNIFRVCVILLVNFMSECLSNKTF